MIDDKDVVDRGDDLVPEVPEVPVVPEAVVGDKLEPADKLEESDETPEEKAERKKVEADAEAKRNIRIPKARFDEAQAKSRARVQELQDKITKLEGGQRAASTKDALSEAKDKINALQDEYEDRILDGKGDAARKIRVQLDALRDDLMDQQTSIKANAARLGAIEELTFKAQLATVEAAHPALNPDFEHFDEDATNEVVELMKAFIASGTTRGEALAKAVRYVIAAPATPSKNPAKVVVVDPRATDARKRAAEADKRQPPSANKVGLDSDRAGLGDVKGLDIGNMSQERFAKLDAATLAKSRGDEL